MVLDCECLFSVARRLKMWLCSTMSQKRFNSLALLNSNKAIFDELTLTDIANDFAEGQFTRCDGFVVLLRVISNTQFLVGKMDDCY